MVRRFLVVALVVCSLSRFAVAADFLDTFDGDPAAPTPWSGPQWDVQVHSRDVGTWDVLESMQAAHGSDCGPPPGTHTVIAYEDAVFQCRSHVMTAINASGYGAVYLTPNQLVDFSAGESVVRFDMSTARTSPRDWVDLWLTPFEDNLALPLNDWLPDLTGPPKNGIHIQMDLANSAFLGTMTNEFVGNGLPRSSLLDYDDVLTPSAMRRDTFELRISDSHLRFGMPDYNLWWIDTPLSALGWDNAVLQLGHHSYNPTKCDTGDNCGPIGPNTWHWDNVEITSAQPFSMLKSDRRFANGSNGTIQFDAAAPENAFLRFAGIGDDLEVSFDGGVNWVDATMQSQRADLLATEHFKSYWMEIPAGTSDVQFRGSNWWGGEWRTKDISIWSLTTSADCDFDGDGVCDVSDLNTMLAEGPLANGVAVTPGQNDIFDLNADGMLDLADRDEFLALAAGAAGLSGPYLVGDANLDGFVDGPDFVAWNDQKFSASLQWDHGDFNGDGTVDGDDFILWNANKFQRADGITAVPEAVFPWHGLALIALIATRQK